MKVVCPRCREEGAPALIRDEEPLSDSREMLGLCEAHTIAVLSQIRWNLARGDGAR